MVEVKELTEMLSNIEINSEDGNKNAQSLPQERLHFKNTTDNENFKQRREFNLSQNSYHMHINGANSQRRKIRDPTWLQVEVCREFMRGECTRCPEECRFAHPKSFCQVESGKVITCYDSLKGRCTRERCKYFHPPKHIRHQIQQLGKSFQHWNRKTNPHDLLHTQFNYPMNFPYGYYWYAPINMFLAGNMYGMGGAIATNLDGYTLYYTNGTPSICYPDHLNDGSMYYDVLPNQLALTMVDGDGSNNSYSSND